MAELTLSQYVKRRTGVALGASGSMQNMFKRAFGAYSFAQFWNYWNPIWGFYLVTKVMRPSRKFLPWWLSLLLTFGVSGAVHDLAVSAVKLKAVFFFTPWFFIMAITIVITQAIQLNYKSAPWWLRAFINLSFLSGCYYITSLFF